MISSNDQSCDGNLEETGLLLKSEPEEFAEDDSLPTNCDEMNDLNEDLHEANLNEDNAYDCGKIDPYAEVSCKEALESFVKLKGFFIQNIPQHLSVILNVEDFLYLGIDHANTK